jgi:hypothetical protein
MIVMKIFDVIFAFIGGFWWLICGLWLLRAIHNNQLLTIINKKV